jgi:hypothetical protein
MDFYEKTIQNELTDSYYIFKLKKLIQRPTSTPDRLKYAHLLDYVILTLRGRGATELKPPSPPTPPRSIDTH